MSDEEDLFVREGIRCYADARRVLHRFEKTLEAQIEMIVLAKSDWTSFTRDKGKSAIKTAHSDGGKGDPKILAVVNGKTSDGHKAQIHTGLIWRQEGVLVFARFRKPKHLVGFEPRPRSGRVKHFKINNRKTFIYVEPSEVIDLTKDLNLILDELQLHVEPVKPKLKLSVS